MRRVTLLIASLLGLTGSAFSQDATSIDESVQYRLKNAGFERLGRDMCVDVFNGGELDNELEMRDCANYSGQLWTFTSIPSALKHLPTYKMTTQFRGPEMCLTVDGTLIDHVLRLAPCTDVPSENQLWSVMAWKGEGARPDDPLPILGWQIEPLISADSDQGSPFLLVVDTPPEGDGRPYVDTKDYVGNGFIWKLKPN